MSNSWSQAKKSSLLIIKTKKCANNMFSAQNIRQTHYQNTLFDTFDRFSKNFMPTNENKFDPNDEKVSKLDSKHNMIEPKQ